MKKKQIIFIVVVILLGLAFWYFKFVFGRMEFRENTDTPKEFLSYVEIKKDDYSRDSIKILMQLKFLLHNHKESFYTKDYFDSTELIIDSILYSPNLNRLAVLVITKNPTYRQAAPNKNCDWYYDGYCYVGVIQNDKTDLNWIEGGYSNDCDKLDLSNSIRQFFFRRFNELKGYDGKPKYNYNLNDIRFWDCLIWKEIEEKKIKKKEFEEEKKKHPENVYEPKQ